MKYHGINPRAVLENYDTSLRDIRKDINKWRNTRHSWTGRLNVVSVYVTDACLIFKRNYKKPRVAKTLLKKNKWEGLFSHDKDLL